MTSPYQTPEDERTVPDHAKRDAQLSAELAARKRTPVIQLDLRTIPEQLPDAMLDDDQLSPIAKLLYWYLTRIAEEHRANVSIHRIAFHLGLPRSIRLPVQMLLGELEDAGWIEDLTYLDIEDSAAYVVLVTTRSTKAPGGAS